MRIAYADTAKEYSRPHEAAEAGMAPIAMELNLFVDMILHKVHQFANGRPTVLSSFTPAVCMLLAIKQKTYPVMFITNAGKVPMLDQEVRAASLQMAVKFAKL
jgi:glycerophosphodiester phosphodiesterase